MDSTAKICELVEKGGVIQDTFPSVSPLTNLKAKKVMISNAPLFIKNESLVKELSQYGQLVSPIRMVSMGSNFICQKVSLLLLLKSFQVVY